MAVSSRVLRKIRGDDNIFSQKNSEDSDVDDTILQNSSRVQSNINRFGLLNGSDSESDVKEDDGDEQEDVPTKQPESNNRVSKKKSKKKKTKPKQKHLSEDLDEVERSVREVNALLGDTSDTPVITKKTTLVGEQGVLRIEKKHLNPKNELRKMFGSEAVQNSEGASMRKRKNRGHIKRLYLMPHISIQPYDPTQSMRIVREENGILYFKYEHDSHYQSVEKKFRSCIESMDTSEFFMIANRYPLHVNTLIQLSETFAINEEYHTAAKFMERSLFALEIAFHPSFNIFKGNCRLDYKIQENRALFIALFQYMISLGEKACYRTALELSKLILSLSPEEDPLAVVLAMDLYAIRSGQYRWLLDFLDEIGPSRNLAMLPNLAYSQALAHFFLEECEKADELLQNALIMFPIVLLQLLEKCHVNPDPETLASDLFMSTRKEPIGYTKSSELFVMRSHYVWKDAAVMVWLEKNTIAVLKRAAKKDPYIAECAAKRAALFHGNLPLVFQRHLFLSRVPFTPTDGGPLYLFDPIPPADSVDVYPDAPEHIEEVQNSLSLFFRSILPSYTAPTARPRNEQRRDDAEDQGAAAGAGVRGVPLLESVNELHDAVSNLLHNLMNPQQNYDDDADSEE